MKKISNITEGWGAMIRRDITSDVREEETNKRRAAEYVYELESLLKDIEHSIKNVNIFSCKYAIVDILNDFNKQHPDFYYFLDVNEPPTQCNFEMVDADGVSYGELEIPYFNKISLRIYIHGNAAGGSYMDRNPELFYRENDDCGFYDDDCDFIEDIIDLKNLVKTLKPEVEKFL